jgi:hypothetical protein
MEHYSPIIQGRLQNEILGGSGLAGSARQTSKGWLKHWAGGSCPAAIASLAVKMREYDFVRKEGHPLEGFVAVCVAAADELVLAVGPAHEFGRAKLTNDLQAMALRKDVI